MRPPAVIRAGQQPDAWKMQSEKPRAEGSAGQGQTQKGKSSDTKSASATTWSDEAGRVDAAEAEGAVARLVRSRADQPQRGMAGLLVRSPRHA